MLKQQQQNFQFSLWFFNINIDDAKPNITLNSLYIDLNISVLFYLFYLFIPIYMHLKIFLLSFSWKRFWKVSFPNLTDSSDF